MSSQGQSNIPTTEYSLKSLSWHAKTISETLTKINDNQIRIAMALENLVQSRKSGQSQMGQVQMANKILNDECPF